MHLSKIYDTQAVWKQTNKKQRQYIFPSGKQHLKNGLITQTNTKEHSMKKQRDSEIPHKFPIKYVLIDETSENTTDIFLIKP